MPTQAGVAGLCVCHLVKAVLERTEGELKDDATVMCLDWHGGPPRSRISDSGADTLIASRRR